MPFSLEDGLGRPRCPSCRLGRLRPFSVHRRRDNQFLDFRCSIRRCRQIARAPLPAIEQKTIIYLDTSIVSKIVKAMHRGELRSPWIDLYKALHRAVDCEVICCPSSSVLKQEAELSAYADDIIHLSGAFADPGGRHDLHVKQAQLGRALDRYVKGDPPEIERSPPHEDAFLEDPRSWQGLYRFSFRAASYPSVQTLKQMKGDLRTRLEAVFSEYEQDGWDCEASGFGKQYAEEGLTLLKQRAGLLPLGPDDEIFSPLLPGILDQMIFALNTVHGLNERDALVEALNFLTSDHAAMVPYADISSRLYAGLAMQHRGPTPRRVRESDAADVTHLATYLPYVDIFSLQTGSSWGCAISRTSDWTKTTGLAYGRWSRTISRPSSLS